MANTTKIWDIFEDKVFGIISDLVITEEFIVNSKISKCYQKREYYSASREANIKTDISIETWLPWSDKFSSLVIIECKDYPYNNIGIEDIEEFDSKLRQIWEHNTKWIMVCLKWFSSTVKKFAENKGIWLIKLWGNDILDWVVYRKVGAKNNIKENFEWTIENIEIWNFWELLVVLKVIDIFKPKTKFIKLPFLTNEDIRKVSTKAPKYIYDWTLLNIQKLIKYLSEKYELNIDANCEPNNTNKKILWTFQTNPYKISIFKDFDNEQRYRFTVAHEVWHFILHSKILSDYQINIKDTNESLWLSDLLGEKNIERIEIQANIFAKELLMPFDSLMI